jgi:hypothetical protein
MAEWTDEQRRQAEQAHQGALERAATFKVGDHAECAIGQVLIVDLRAGGYHVALLEDVERLEPGRHPEDVAFYIATADLKPLPGVTRRAGQAQDERFA